MFVRRGRNHANRCRCLPGAARDGLEQHFRRCRRVVRELPPWRLELRLFFIRAMLGYRARLGGKLCAEPLPGNRLWVIGWKLEQSRGTQALSAGLLGERRTSPRRLQIGFSIAAEASSGHASDHCCHNRAGRDGVVERPRRCRCVVRNFAMGQRKLRLFLLRSVLGHRARHRRILPT